MKHRILIASTNRHKVAEIQKIFDLKGITFESLHKFPHIAAAEENGNSFKDNALIKATYYYHHTQLPVIADDSGLVVPVLNGEPGVLSARYAGIDSSYAENNRLLLSRMSEFRNKQRSAYFVCVAVFFNGKNTICAEGKAEGMILETPRGENGFGYDPLFYYPPARQTFAEMTETEKNKVSHRFRAIEVLKGKLEEILCNNA